MLFQAEVILKETDGTNDRDYTWTDSGYGDLVSAYDGSGTLYYEADALGSTEALLDDSSSVTDRYAYLAFGLATQTSGGTTQPHTFVGKQGYYQDKETDLYWIRRRAYDPVNGRWVSEDRSGYKGGDLNLYRYCHNDPVNHTDPSGDRIFVAADEVKPCANNEGSRSDVTDRLRDEIFEGVGPLFSARDYENFWPQANYKSIDFASGRQTIKRSDYRWVDPLLRSLPPVVWSKLHNNQYGGACLRRYAGSLKEQVTGPNWLIRSPKKQRYGVECVDWNKNFPSGYGRVVDAINEHIVDPILRDIEWFVRAVGGPLLQAGLDALLWLMGIKPDDFWMIFEDLKSGFDSVQKLIEQPKRFAETVIGGFKWAFNELKDGFPENVLRAFFSWLLGRELPELPKKLNTEEIGNFLLKLAGFDPEGLKELGNKITDEDGVAPGLSALLETEIELGSQTTTIGAIINNPAAMLDVVDEFSKEDSGLVMAAKEFVVGIVKAVAITLIEKAIGWALALVGPGLFKMVFDMRNRSRAGCCPTGRWLLG